MQKIKTLFLDIGGVLMTNGWDHTMREQTVREFHLEPDEFEQRHKKYNPLLETGQISVEEYFNHTVFWKPRFFTMQQIKDYMFAFSQPYADTIRYFEELREKLPIDIAFISNEGRELAIHRIHLANLNALADYFFVSAFVFIQKPDLRIYQLALDVMQRHADEIFYIDDRPKLIESAASLGIRGCVHESLETTQKNLLEIL
ncbi:MAG: HAD hydrolase-like protein [Parachlamydiaceae bacterium]